MTKKNMKRVEGYNNLYRNEQGAIVNTDQKAYEAYKRRRAASMKKEAKVSTLEAELDATRTELEEIRELLKQFLDK